MLSLEKSHNGMNGAYVYVTSTAATANVTGGVPSAVSAAGGALEGAVPVLQLTVALTLEETHTCDVDAFRKAYKSFITRVWTAATEGRAGAPSVAPPVMEYCTPARAA